MTTRRSAIDRRLLGTWKSDKRRTFKVFVPWPGQTPEKLEKLKLLFGKLVLRFSRRQMHSSLNGVRQTTRYKVLASDSDSVAIIFYNNIFEEDRIQHIHFEDDCYWVWAWGMREYFKRVPKISRKPTASNRKG